VIRTFTPLVVAVAVLLSAPGAHAHDTTWSISAKGGVSFFLNSQSLALEHRIKPVVRLEGAFRVIPRFSVAIELVAAATSEAGYRLIGGYMLGKAHLYSGDIFQLNLAAGWGLGTGARILSHDLQAEADVAVWLQAGLQFRWALVADRFDLGLDLLSENISTIGASLVAEVHF